MDTECTMSSKRKFLTLEERVKCLKLFESGKSSRVIASELHVGRTQVLNVLKRKREIMEEFESNGDPGWKRLKRDTEYTELNTLVYKWFIGADVRFGRPTGAMIQDKAKMFAIELGLKEFKGSNGWLGSFLKRNHIVLKTKSGNRGEIKNATDTQWEETITTVCQGYESKDIFTMDEIGLFYKNSTSVTGFKKGDACSDGEHSTERMTIAVCASMAGEKLTPLVIGKSPKPLYFGSISADQLPVRFEANRKAWMTNSLMEDWLRTLDREMGSQNRKILLLLDNAPIHPNIELTNVKLQFFPSNTTSGVQPMDSGIIQTLKLNYRRRQLQHVLEEMEKQPSKPGIEILRDITILEAISWISAAWCEIKENTIVECFRQCNLTAELISVSVKTEHVLCPVVKTEVDHEDEIPFNCLWLSRDMFDLDVHDLVKVDDNLATCDDGMIDWDRPAPDIIEELKATEQDTACDDERDLPSSSQSISISEVTECIKKLKNFALAKNNKLMLDKIVGFQDAFVQFNNNDDSDKKF
ncbi:tigger transposable element-derived protein 4-like [Dreissena polymorpha]|uniref:tigger transposable element-derived protein 4-like n=1 Tax=Dreissena polymorpha TaxID=45954 RepID=UPI002263EF67|nr:tigger transposable element-derived protein 4-like [Dreissena polymorpha]